MTISYLSMVLGLLLLLPGGYLIYAYDRLSWKKALTAVVRLLAQMAVIGSLLWGLYSYGSPWLALLWLALLVVAAAFLMVSRCHIRSRVLFAPACVAMFVSVLVVTAYVLLVVLQPQSPLSVRWTVPVMGLLMAHVLTTNIPAVRTYFDCLHQDSQAYFTVLGNGGRRRQALAPYVARALKSITVPTMANLSVMGLLVMPMLLSGLLIGGMDAVEAVFVFVVLVLACVATSLLSLVLILILVDCRAFTPQGQLANIFSA